MNAARPRKYSQNTQPTSQQLPAQPVPQPDKGSDYVYFNRSTAGFSAEAVPKAKAAQLKLEHYYKVAVETAVERNARYARGAHKQYIICLLVFTSGALNWNASSTKM